MKNILILGAGRSSGYLIDYLLAHASSCHWTVSVGDLDINLAKNQCNAHENARAFALEADNETQLSNEIFACDAVVSMLPFGLHPLVAKLCVQHRKAMFTASYVGEKMQELHEEAVKNGVLLLNEMGLDPGIDHISALKIVDEIVAKGGKIHEFRSYCGGLVAPESNDNPWGYKFTWNPRNVVLAGQGTVKYLENDKFKYLPYHRLFTQTQAINLGKFGLYEGYANRDSLKYRSLYGLNDLKTIFRGTLRSQGFCSAWNVFVQLGVTDDTYTMENSAKMTKKQYLEAFLPTNVLDAEQYIAQKYGDEVAVKMAYLGLFIDEPLNLHKDATPAQILQHILEPKLSLNPTDKDMVVMWHEFVYEQGKKMYNLQSYMVLEGETAQKTAMSKTVGLPLAIAVKMYLQGKITKTGVQIPNFSELYLPVFEELEQLGVVFVEQQTEL